MMQLTEQQKKEGWRIVKFDEIAKSVSKRVEPGNTDLEVYVGLEHLDPDNLRITRRGVPSDVTGQKLRVRPGQIIFGKRRAYQRKVAVADFDGICSAHAMVLEAIPKAVLPEYLPFFMQSDMFMERAVSISEGSLSPTIKWKTLANQEFPLPPRKRQEELIKLFNPFEHISLLHEALEDKILALYKKLASELVSLQSESNQVYLKDLSLYITSGSRGWAKYYSDTGDLFIRITNMQRNTLALDFSDNAYVKLPTSSSEGTRTRVEKDDILISITADIGTVSQVSHTPTQNAYVNQHICLVRPNKNKINASYLSAYLKSPAVYHFFQSLNGGGAKAGLSLNTIQKIKVPIPNERQQNDIASIFSAIENFHTELREKKTKFLKMKSFVNNVMWGQHDRI